MLIFEMSLKQYQVWRESGDEKCLETLIKAEADVKGESGNLLFVAVEAEALKCLGVLIEDGRTCLTIKNYFLIFQIDVHLFNI